MQTAIINIIVNAILTSHLKNTPLVDFENGVIPKLRGMKWLQTNEDTN